MNNMMKNSQGGVRKYSNCLLLIIFFSVSMIILGVINNEYYFFDSRTYAFNSERFWQANGFTLRNYGHSIRGVWFPLIMSPFLHWDMYWGWRILAAAMVTTFVMVFPQIIAENKEEKIYITVIKRSILFCLLWMFWPGLFIYPLSDAPALMFIMLGLYFIKKKQVWSYVLAGGMIYIAYNTRTIYLFTGFILGICYAIYLKANREKVLSFMVSFLIGICLFSLPQVIVNWDCHKEISMKVYTENSGYGDSLFAWQLAEGLRFSEYETYVGTEEEYPTASVVFRDPVGEKIIAKEGIVSAEVGIFGIFKTILKYPFDVLGIWARHFINMLNPVWGEVYIFDLSKFKLHLTLINYMVLFILTTWLGTRRYKFNLNHLKDEVGLRGIGIFTMLVPCIAILPGCVELRFFFPMYMILYCIVLFVIGEKGIKEIWGYWKQRPLFYLMIFICGFAALCAVWGNTYSNIQFDFMMNIP